MEDFEKRIRDAIASIKEREYKDTVIIIANPNDLADIDLDETPTSFWISPDANIERGKMLVLKDDSEIKKDLYNLFSEHPERIMRGKENIILKKVYGVDSRTTMRKPSEVE